jgi:hypothetical protein
MRGLRQKDASAAEKLIQRLNYKRQDEVVEIRLESVVYTITQSGLVQKPEAPFVYRKAS